MDDDLKTELIASHEVEILPPERDQRVGDGPGPCLCCGRFQSFMDDDGCGICEKCLAAWSGPQPRRGLHPQLDLDRGGAAEVWQDENLFGS
jgi:hypothetical protein